jgi:DNA-binding transcriptional MerR regulator
LKPKRTSAGYRAYSAGDVDRLEQIVALKFLGIPLKKIGLLITRTRWELARALDAQNGCSKTNDGCSTRPSGESRPVEIIISGGRR